LPDITIKPLPPTPEAKKADPDIVEIDSIPIKAPKPAKGESENGTSQSEGAHAEPVVQVAGKKRAEPEQDAGPGAAEEAERVEPSKKRKVEEIIFIDDDE
jgi:hypothetical protein